VLRTTKFVKYLRDFGWQSTVIAPNWRVAPRGDVGFGEDIPPETEVVRAGWAEDWPRIWRLLDQVPYLWRWGRLMRAGLQYPDACSHWRAAVLAEAQRVLREKRHQLIYSTSPPVTSHYVALQLKSEFSLPWVADFRDPWTDNLLSYHNPWEWRRRIDLRLEHRIHQAADMVVANTRSNHATIIEKHRVPPEKVTTITNGYDEADFTQIEAWPGSERFRIMYSGSFYGEYTPSTFLSAFRRFLVEENRPKTVLSLAGDSSAWAHNYVTDPTILAHLELLGNVPHRKVCRLLSECNLLLHVYPKRISYSVPSKLYEYLRSGTPIVAVCDRPSEVSQLLDETGQGRVFRHDEIDDLTTHLRNCYRQWEKGDIARRIGCRDGLTLYSRRNLASQLAGVFDRLLRK